MSQAQRAERQYNLVEISRIGLYAFVLILMIIAWVLRPHFFNWDTDARSLILIISGFIHHGLVLAGAERFSKNPKLLLSSFIIDTLILGALVFLAGPAQSIFLFLILVHIFLSGLLLRSRGALNVAILSAILFSLATILGPELKTLNYIFLLLVNNAAFLLVAGLSGYLSDQLAVVGYELQKTGKTLVSLKQLNQLIVEHIPSGLITFNQDGEVLTANQSAHEILEDDSLIGKNVFDFLKSVGIRDAGLDRFDYVYKTQSQQQKTLGLVVSNVEDPQLTGPLRIALIEDLTKIRFLENQVKQSEKMAAIGGLAAGIAHEIRNPLAGISGSVEMLSQTIADEDDKKLMKIILKEIDRLNNLITEFLEFSKPEKPPVDEVDLSVLITEVLDSMSLAKNVRSDIRISRTLPMRAMVRAQREKLKQALLNITLNALQAMQDTLHPLLEVKLEQDDKGYWLLSIIDNGCGMNEATKKKMFEPFHTTKAKGTGLGLAITYKILENHQVTLNVQSEVGVGTNFGLQFPSIGPA